MAGLIEAHCKDEKLQVQIHEAITNGSQNAFDIWWLGQSGFLVQWNKQCILFDPYLSDSLTKKYAATNKQHIRMSERVVDPRLLDCIKIVTSSHNHTDHLDAETLIPILEANPGIAFVIPEANREFVQQRVRCAMEFPIGLDEGRSVTIGEFTFYGLASAHNEIERNDKGQCKFMGYIVQFGKFTVYHSGDTLWYDGIEASLKRFKIDVAFLPINGNDPSRGVAGNLSAPEAALLGKVTGARYVVPHHYNMFTFNTADPAHFMAESEKIGQPYFLPKHGEKLTIL